MAVKRIFADPSLAIAALGIGREQLAYDLNTFGFMFENLVARDLSVYASSIGGYLRHYRDRGGLECDHVIHFDNDKYGLIQTKLGYADLEQAEEKLLELKRLILEKNKELKKKKQKPMKEPTFLMIIYGGDMAFTTKNGILVVPIGCLKD